VLEDMQGRSFQVLTEVSVFHTVQRGRNTIRTVAVKEDGLHFAIKKLSKGEKEDYKRQRIDADFLLVGMKVFGSQYYQSQLMHNPKDQPLCTWPRTLYFAEEDVVQMPVTARDVVLISRKIMEHLMRACGTIAETEITAELEDAYKELAIRPRELGDWD
jgi:hypothetical protein